MRAEYSVGTAVINYSYGTNSLTPKSIINYFDLVVCLPPNHPYLLPHLPPTPKVIKMASLGLILLAFELNFAYFVDFRLIINFILHLL
ncbi:unnamed protein product, partial [Vitis vinifera]